MLIRFQVKNLYSFEEETEFNLLTNDSEHLPHHKKHCNGVDFLRLSAIYGANASGKSNFVRAIGLLQNIVKKGKIIDEVSDYKFKLSGEALTKPISLAIELLSNSKMYYYTLTFDQKKILNETLVETFKDKEDRIVFERSLTNERQEIPFIESEVKNEKERMFLELLSDKLLSKDELLLTFLTQKYPNEYADIDNVFEWFSDVLIVLNSNFKIRGIAHKFDTDDSTTMFANAFIPTLGTGIQKIDIQKREIVGQGNEMNYLKDNIKNDQEQLFTNTNPDTGEEITFVMEENDKIFAKRIFTEHLDKEGHKVFFPFGWESDGTKRLLEYTPLINGVINAEVVFVVDEIERSIHPMMIKELIKKISSDTSAQGQLIFTTHESCLLDQEILRTDEIWFTQKDKGGATHMYSLSDFNISNTANIEDGYLNGRYGGIPFLSNLKELNWHTDESISD
ncbi:MULTISPECIES: AAA family ATPase [Capnocytophaga]|jgi:abortive phage resistance protein-like protein|uniref:AAA family ATPase n=1 Tax=Capnocytophaga TaxID=1016 RepID=UPI00027C40D0|nr:MULTISPECIES: ATP-binding protein [Capnocytophaga]EJU33944.1 AAA domain protein [Capnocytophaga sp. CM59]